jgi:hypothetical protein
VKPVAGQDVKGDGVPGGLRLELFLGGPVRGQVDRLPTSPSRSVILRRHLQGAHRRRYGAVSGVLDQPPW